MIKVMMMMIEKLVLVVCSEIALLVGFLFEMQMALGSPVMD